MWHDTAAPTARAAKHLAICLNPQIPIELAQDRLQQLLRRIVSSLTMRLFAHINPLSVQANGRMASGAKDKQQTQRRQQQRLLLEGAAALREVTAMLGVEGSEMRAVAVGVLPLMLQRLIFYAESQLCVLPLSSTSGVEMSQQELRMAAIRIFQGLQLTVEAVRDAAVALMGAEAEAEAVHQMAVLASRRLLPELTFAALSQLLASHAEARSSSQGGLLSLADSITEGVLEAEQFTEKILEGVRDLLGLSVDQYMNVLQVGFFLAAAPLRRSLEVFATMRNEDGCLQSAEQLLALDRVRAVANVFARKLAFSAALTAAKVASVCAPLALLFPLDLHCCKPLAACRTVESRVSSRMHVAMPHARFRTHTFRVCGLIKSCFTTVVILKALERLVGCSVAAPRTSSPKAMPTMRINRRRQRSSQREVPPESNQRSCEDEHLIRLLLAYLRAHALLGEAPETAAAEAHQQTLDFSKDDNGGPLGLQLGQSEEALSLQRIVNSRKETTIMAASQTPDRLSARTSEYVLKLLFLRHQPTQQESSTAAAANAYTERWKQLNSIDAK